MIQSPKIVPKDWGKEIIHCNNDKYCGKTLGLKEGFYCSLHSHRKLEDFAINTGNVLLALEVNRREGQWGEIEFFELYPTNVIQIPENHWHSFYGLEDSEIIEFSTPDTPSARLFSSGRSGAIEWEKQIREIWEGFLNR